MEAFDKDVLQALAMFALAVIAIANRVKITRLQDDFSSRLKMLEEKSKQRIRRG